MNICSFVLALHLQSLFLCIHFHFFPFVFFSFVLFSLCMFCGDEYSLVFFSFFNTHTLSLLSSLFCLFLFSSFFFSVWGCCQIRGFSSSASLRSILAGDGEFLVSTRVLSLVLAFVWLLRTLFSHSFGTCHRHAFSSSSSSLDKVLYQFLSSFSLVYPCVQFLLLRSISHCIRVCWLDFFLFIFFILAQT